VLYALVFCTRYLDIFSASASGGWLHVWNFCLKLFYVASSFYIIFLMTSVYARTREREKAWKYGLYCFLVSVVVTPFWWLIFSYTITYKQSNFVKVCPTLYYFILPLIFWGHGTRAVELIQYSSCGCTPRSWKLSAWFRNSCSSAKRPSPLSSTPFTL